MLSDHHKWPAILGLFYWNSQPQQLYSNITITGALISVLPLALAFLTLQRYWRSGLSAGSGKHQLRGVAVCVVYTSSVPLPADTKRNC